MWRRCSLQPHTLPLEQWRADVNGGSGRRRRLRIGRGAGAGRGGGVDGLPDYISQHAAGPGRKRRRAGKRAGGGDDYPEPTEPSRPRAVPVNGRWAPRSTPQAVAAGKPLAMSTVAAASCDAKGAGEAGGEKKPLKACCACPETKKARDAW